MAKILIIDDDCAIFDLFKVSLSHSVDLVFIDDLDLAENQIFNNHFDLIVLDIHFPNENSLGLIENIKLHSPSTLTRIIVMTASREVDTEIASHQFGVRDFIKKPLNLKLLKAVIEKHLFAITNKSENIIKVSPFILDLNQQSISLEEDGEILDLTNKEFKILKFFLESPNIVISRDQLLTSLWEIDSSTSSRSLDMHISSIRKKISPHSNLIQTKRGQGYILNLK